MKIKKNQIFKSRQDISNLLGGDTQKGIAISSQKPAILLFVNEENIYTDYFYPKGTYDYCMYTGIGRIGHQDSVKNNMYALNLEVLTHIMNHKSLCVFEKRETKYYFVGRYQLIETHQNVQPDAEGDLRRVFVFHLKKIEDEITF